MSARRLVAACVPVFAGLVALAVAQPPKPADPTFDRVPRDSAAFVTLKVAKLWDHKSFSPVREARGKLEFAWMVQGLVGVSPAEMDTLAAFWPAGKFDVEQPFVVVRTRQLLDLDHITKLLTRAPGGPKKVAGGKVIHTPGAEFPHLMPLDDRTVLFAPKSATPDDLLKLASQGKAGPLAAAVDAAKDHTLTVGLDIATLVGVAVPFGGPLLEAKTAVLTADLEDEKSTTAKVKLAAAFATPEKAKAAQPILRAKLDEIAGYVLAQEKKQAAAPADSTALPGPLLEWIGQTLKAAKVTTEGTTLAAAGDVNLDEGLFRLLVAVPDAVLAPRGGGVSENNLKQIGLAVHNYHDANGHMPQNIYDKDGKAILSWRVQILPYIEQDNVYKNLKLDEPWDSPANKNFTQLNIKVFMVPGRPTEAGYTHYRSFIGPKNVKPEYRPWLIDDPKAKMRLTDITDGTSNTIMVVEAGEAVPWAKPDELPYDGLLPLPRLGGPDGRFGVLMGDGSVRTLKVGQVGEKNLRGAITVAGGEVIVLP